MAHLFQVGAGSGGMPVLDLLCRDERIHRVTLVEPDIYKPHNVERHLFALRDVGQPKAELARQWLRQRRPDLDVQLLLCDLTDPLHQGAIHEVLEEADLGVCAADNEEAKYHFDALMRRHGKPWTLGEVLSGGIGGFVHCFVRGGPCYGCVASYLQRTVRVDDAPPPDYSAPGHTQAELTIPASKASIAAIASLHALMTLELLADPTGYRPDFTTLLWTLRRVEGVFDEAFHPYRFRIARAGDCLTCMARPTPASLEDLDVALDEALARLADV
jgi:molybdopterin/thiamine biosynthesis adenylyltransferase